MSSSTDARAAAAGGRRRPAAAADPRQPDAATDTGRAGRDGSSIAYLARQPIFDLRGQVVAYELLQRTAPGTAFDNDDERMTLAVAAKALLEFGLDRLVGTALAYVNTPVGFLRNETYRILPADRTVLEVLERSEVDGELVASLRQARAEGYRLALDDYQGNPAFDPLMPHVDIVKVDIAGLSRAEVRSVFERTKRKAPHATVLAEKVETQRELSLVKSLGAQLFQGFYFARPTTLQTRQVPAHAPVLLQLTAALDGADLDLHQVARIVSHEPRVSYRLLRLVNSASVGVSREIDSVERAVTMVGAEQLRRLVLLLLVTTDAKGPDEIVNLAILRAKMAETLAAHYGCEPAAAFTTGMLSMLDVAFGIPMAELVAGLPLSDAIRGALVSGEGALGMLLDDIVAYERGPEISRPELARTFVAAYAAAAATATDLRQALGSR